MGLPEMWALEWPHRFSTNWISTATLRRGTNPSAMSLPRRASGVTHAWPGARFCSESIRRDAIRDPFEDAVQRLKAQEGR